MGFREMRRKRQELGREACEDILRTETAGVLALSGEDDYPYAVPISYVYDGDCIYFHGATQGHKVDAIRRNPKASFCVIGQDDVVEEELTTYFKSVIVFGKIRMLEGDEKRRACEKLGYRYAPEEGEHMARSIEKSFDHLGMFELKIEHMSGKQAIELVPKRNSTD